MVLSMSECPIQSCTVRRSTPPHSAQVANVARNLCSQKSSGFSFARCATILQASRKSSFGFPPAVENKRKQPGSLFAFHFFNAFTSLFGMGISRPLYAFGENPYSRL